MTYLDLLMTALYHGLTLTWPLCVDLATDRLFQWAADPVVGPMMKALCGIGAGLAMIVLLNRELRILFRSAYLAVKRRQEGSFGPLLMLLAGSLPVVALDIIAIPNPLSLGWMAASLLVAVGLAFLAADRLGVTVRDLDHLSLASYLIIWLLQAAGGILGIAIQITTIILARLMGCERNQALKLAWLFAIPHLLLGVRDLILAPTAPPGLDALLIGTMSFAAALIGGSVLLTWLKRKGFTAFAVTQIIIGLVMVLSVSSFGR